MTEYELMKSDPQSLFNQYMAQLQAGIPLDDSQVVKMEYLKKLLLKE